MEARGKDCTISNCYSDLNINSLVNGDGTHAGFVAVNKCRELHISNCQYAGTMDFSNFTTNCAGFVGFTDADCNVRLYHCLLTANFLRPAYDMKSSTFVRDETNGNITYDNCYYLNPLNKKQGTEVTLQQLHNGTIAAMLEWGQKLDGQSIPRYGFDNNRISCTLPIEKNRGMFCLPFTVEITDSLNHIINCFRPLEVSDYTPGRCLVRVGIYSVGDVITAGTPVIFHRLDTITHSVTLSNYDYLTYDPEDVEVGCEWTFHGTYDGVSGITDAFVLKGDNFIYQEGKSVDLPAYSVWFDRVIPDSSYRTLVPVESDEEWTEAMEKAEKAEEAQDNGSTKTFVNGKLVIRKANGTGFDANGGRVK